MQAKVLKAKLLGDPSAAQLEKEYEEARDRADNAPRVAVLPTHDMRGQVYDVGSGKNDAFVPGNVSVVALKVMKYSTHNDVAAQAEARSR
jgi:hypothetical protein